MRRRAPAALAALILGAAMQPVFAQSTVSPQHPGDPGYDALLHAATAPVREAFGDAVSVEVERLDRLGRWAFLQGSLRDANGGPARYAGTRYAERAEQGGMSDVYVALLQMPDVTGADAPDRNDGDAGDTATDTTAGSAPGRDARVAGPVRHADGTPDEDDAASPTPWVLVDHSIGPSDVSWLTWPTDHAAPRQLFGF